VAVKERFSAVVASSPGQETKRPVGPASAKVLDYDPDEIDALAASVRESFCEVFVSCFCLVLVLFLEG
jgi:hypothetical protein